MARTSYSSVLTMEVVLTSVTSIFLSGEKSVHGKSPFTVQGFDINVLYSLLGIWPYHFVSS